MFFYDEETSTTTSELPTTTSEKPPKKAKKSKKKKSKKKKRKLKHTDLEKGKSFWIFHLDFLKTLFFVQSAKRVKRSESFFARADEHKDMDMSNTATSKSE